MLGDRPGPATWIAAVEVVLVFAAIMVHIWWIRPYHPRAWVWILLAMVLSHRARGESFQDLGFCRAGLERCFTSVISSLSFLTLSLLAFGAVFNTYRSISFEQGFLNLVFYIPWGLFQQYILNGYFVNRLRIVFPENGGNAAAVAGAALFALAHVPNEFLMLITLLGGYACARIYLKYRNLLVLGLLHGAVGFALHLVVPDSVSHYFKVGPGYYGG